MMAPAAALTEIGETPLTRRLVGFSWLVRDNGFAVGVAESLDALALARCIALGDPRQLRWGLRSLFCANAGEWTRFDELFDAYWRRVGMRHAAWPATTGAGDSESGEGARFAPPEHAESGGDASDGGGRRGGASRTERLTRTDFRKLTDAEDREAVYALAERLAAGMRWRLTRRYRQRAQGRVIDLRNTIHNSLRHGGTPLDLAFRTRRPRPIRLVALLDASGSMSPYSAFFMRFVRGIVDHFDKAEAFVFHTRLVHLSPALRERNIDKAMERMAVMSEGWGGGTRIGDCLARFNDHHAKTVLDARSVVMVLSDGYDTGPPERLGREMARLKRRARRVVWLNPLLGWEGYEPVARGMIAALPHVDLFAPAHNLESLMALEPYLCRL